MSDDLDNLLRATMKTLDDQMPSGYFEALPERVSARLAADKEVEAPMQQTSSSGPTKTSAPAAPMTDVSSGVPPVGAPREEDSGLHDIRNLAQSTKQRLSVKRIATNPPVSAEDDVLASSSASWKNLALPQPAKMVSLPEIDQLPSKADIVAQDKAARAAAKAAAKEAKVSATGSVATAAPVADAVTSTASGATSAPVDFKPAFSAFANRAPKKSNMGRNLALVGMGLAAAAGIVIFVTTQNNSSRSEAPAAEDRAKSATTGHSLDEGKAKLDEATAKLAAQHAAAEKAEADNAAAAAAAPTAAVDPAPAPPPEDKVDAAKDATTRGTATKGAAHHVAPKSKSSDKPKEDAKPEKTPEPGKKVGKGEPGDPSFDELLKEAGVDQNKKDKPKLEKKDLTGDDFKKGMSAVQSKAAACFKGTQGTADVKLTIAPSGQVSKVTVGGVFKGKPEADCVAAAVKGASFPAWDGAPKSFGYPILLSE
jgi:hypothetical protein